MDDDSICPYTSLSNFVDLCIHHHSPWLFYASPTNTYTLVDQLHLVFHGFTPEQKAMAKQALRVPCDESTDTVTIDRTTYDLWEDDESCKFTWAWEPLWMHIEKTGTDRFEAYFRDAHGRYSCRRFVYDEGDTYAKFIENRIIIPWLPCQS